VKKYLFIVLLVGVCFGQESWNEEYLKAYGKLKYSPNSKKPFTGNAHSLHYNGNLKSEGRYKDWSARWEVAVL